MTERTKLLAMLAALTGVTLQILEDSLSKKEYNNLIAVNTLCWNKREISPEDFYRAIKDAEQVTGFRAK